MFEEVYQKGRCVDSGKNHWFFSDRPEELAAAQRLCAECPVRLRCLELALHRKEEWGVWGGVVFWEGRPYHRKRGRGRPARADLGLPLEADRDELWEAIRSA